MASAESRPPRDDSRLCAGGTKLLKQVSYRRKPRHVAMLRCNCPLSRRLCPTRPTGWEQRQRSLQRWGTGRNPPHRGHDHSPDGQYVVAQRNQTSVLLDVNKKTAVKELFPEQVGRFVFSQSGAYGIAVLEGGTTVVSYDLATATELWRSCSRSSLRPARPWPSSVTMTNSSCLGDADRLSSSIDVGGLRGP